MNEIAKPHTADEAERSAKSHPFAEQDKLASRAATNQTATFWRSPRSAKNSAPPIGAIEGPTGSFS